jgi:hypothetical protein
VGRAPHGPPARSAPGDRRAMFELILELPVLGKPF